MKVPPTTGSKTNLQRNKTLSSEALRVQKALDKFDLPLEVLELPNSTRTSQEAAEAIGCELGQIAKSMVFENRDTGEVILIIVSGSNRVEVERLGEMVDTTVGETRKQPSVLQGSTVVEAPVEQISQERNSSFRLASPKIVLEKTGFAVGGVPPVGHRNSLPTYIDRDLEQYDEIWAAAGTAHAVFRLTPEDLRKITGGAVVEVR